jgi:hypothetical protein
MQIQCPKCKTWNWLENEKQCHICQTVLRRCIDCSHFDQAKLVCRIHDFDMTKRQAEEPTLLSTSASCLTYEYYHAVKVA